MSDQNKQEMAGRQSAFGCAAQTDWQSLSLRSLWEVLLFILISIAAWQFATTEQLALLPAEMQDLFGYPPPAVLVTAALAVYCFSSLLLVLTQIAEVTEPLPSWSHLCYRSAFYFFYALSGSLESHFMAVFLIGFLLYGVQQVQIWNYLQRAEQQDKELLGER